MMFKNQLSACLVAALVCFGGHAMAQEKKEEKRVKLVFVKDGKEHTLDETYTGEMSEELKAKIAKFKEEMGAGNEMEFHTADGKDFQFKTKSPENSNFFFVHTGEEGDTEGVIVAKIKQADGSIKTVEKKFTNDEEMQKAISDLKKEAGNNLLTLDVSINKNEVIEIDADGEAPEGAEGHLTVKQDGKVVLEETFEGTEIPKEVQDKIDALKSNGKPVEVTFDVRVADDKTMHQHDAPQRVIIKKHKGADSGWTEVEGINKVKAGDDVKVEFDGEGKKIIKVEIDGEGSGEHIWISQDGQKTKLGEGKYEYVIEEKVEGDGKGKMIKVIIQTIIIEDLTEEDKARIPSNLRESKGEAFGESMSDLNFYPNPNNGEFELSFNLAEKGDTQIEVLDLTGKTVFSDKLDDFTGTYRNRIDMKDLPKGMYILKVAQNKHVMTKKIVLE